jgi:hypothetical protein
MNRLRSSVSVVLAAVSLVAALAALAGGARAEVTAPDGSGRPPTPTVTKAPSARAAAGKRSHDGFFLRLSLGAVYLHESWNPAGGSPGAVYGGGGTSFEVSIGKSVRPGLIVGGLWQLVAVTDPNESYLGTTYVVAETDRFVEVIAGFVDDYPNPRRGFHLGGSAGLLAASNLDRGYGVFLTTSLGAALAVRCGYDVFFSSRWSVGALAQLQGYRYSTTETNVSSVSYGLLPTLALAFTFN